MEESLPPPAPPEMSPPGSPFVIESCDHEDLFPSMSPPQPPPCAYLGQCLVCGEVLVKPEPCKDQMPPEEEGGGPPGGRHWLLSFCNLFGVTGPVKNKWIAMVEATRGGNGLKRRPFCDSCREQIALLLELDLRIMKLEIELKTGKEVVRQKVNDSRWLFRGERGVGDESGGNRVEREIRSQIVKKSRLLRKASTYDKPTASGMISLKQESSKLTLRPIVLLSAVDKNEAEKHCNNTIIPNISVTPTKRRGRPPSRRKTKESDTIVMKEETVIVAEDFLDISLDSPGFAPPPSPEAEDSFDSEDNGDDEDFEPFPAKQRGGRVKRRPRRKKKARMKVESDEEDLTHKKKRKPKDEDYVPPEEDGNGEEDAEEFEGSSDEGEGNDCDENYGRQPIGKRSRGRFKLDKKTGKCSYKGTTFQRQISSDTVVPREDQFECLKCGETGIRKWIRKHVDRNHTRIPCKECGLFFSLYKLTLHIGSAHTEKTRRTCTVCGKPDLSLSGIKRHMWTHLGQEEKEAKEKAGELPYGVRKPNQCDECGKGFVTISEMEKHKLRAHLPQEEKSLLKEVCPKCGAMVAHLNAHIREVHAEVKRHVCDYCGKPFARASGLRHHRTAVHGTYGTSFKCTLCPREFPQERQLTAHMNTHLNIRPWACEFCGVAFTRKSHVQRHVQTYHEEGSKPGRKCYVRGPEQKKPVRRSQGKQAKESADCENNGDEKDKKEDDNAAMDYSINEFQF